jgi:glutamine amidotransferase
MKKKIGIIDYGMGNLWSIKNAFDYLGYENHFFNDYKKIDDFSHIILPGVGAFKKAIRNLQDIKLFKPLKKIIGKKTKLLGICLGMQLLFDNSTEDGFTEGLGLVKGKVEKFSSKELKLKKIPHVGYNQVFFERNKFFNGIKNNADFYFDHSYRIKKYDENIFPIYSNYGTKFLSGFIYKNIYAAQFHPEKSQSNGLLFLNNFVNR